VAISLLAGLPVTPALILFIGMLKLGRVWATDSVLTDLVSIPAHCPKLKCLVHVCCYITLLKKICIVLYCIVLYCIVLYCIVLYVNAEAQLMSD
jgi:hypothetical protein